MTKRLDADESERELVFECDIDAPVEQVWRALTKPELIAAWLMENDFAAELGGRFTLRGTGKVGEPERVDCQVIACELHKTIAYSWRESENGWQGRESVVTFSLIPLIYGGTRLRLSHRAKAGAGETNGGFRCAA